MGDKREKIVITLAIPVLLIMTLTIIFLGFSITGNATYSEQPNATEGIDTYIRQDSPLNYSTDTILKVGKVAGGQVLNSLLKFNISSIPSSYTIVNATLEIYLETSSNTNAITLNTYQVSSDWIEEATWDNATSSTPWSTAGGDYTTQINSTTINETGWYSIDLRSLVQDWVSGAEQNYGILLHSPTATAGDSKEFASSDHTTSSLRPKLTITHVTNAIPTINSINQDSTQVSPKQIGEDVTFTVNWSDLESDNTQIYICNSSSITVGAGCIDTTFCSTSLAATNPTICSYTILESDNKTTSFWVATCDAGNCSAISSENFFYLNHNPAITLTQPNGGETVNQSQGNYSIIFNVNDTDSDALTADIYYGSTQGATTNEITSNINLSTICTDGDGDTATTNTCTYSWNSSGIYGTYFLTIVLNDSTFTSNTSSTSSFDVRSIIDNIAPQIIYSPIASDIYSGETVQVDATITDDNLITAWIKFNYTSANSSMTNTSAINFRGFFTAPSAGSHSYKVYAQDQTENLNDFEQWQTFTVRAPNANTSNEQYPTTALPFHTIRITGDINTTDALTNTSAYLNVPSGFTFLTDYPQNAQIGNISTGQIKTAEWYLSAPLTESTYTLNITYTDQYSNSWQSDNFQVEVTSAVGGGYEVDLTGSPEVGASETYIAETTFKQSGQPTAPDSIEIIIYDAAKNLIPTNPMTLKSTGVYNYSYSVGAAPVAGLWETIINATISGTSYYTNEFWKVVGALFDVRDITIIDAETNDLNISVILENIGNNPTDLFLEWNLTREDNGAILDSGFDTIGVGATPITHYVTPSTSYVGQVRITFMGVYLTTERAAAYEVFSTTDGNETPIIPPTTGGGGGGGGEATTQEEKYTLEIIDFQKIINLTKNIQKTITIKVKNTGSVDLTNVQLTIDNLNKEIFQVSPTSITKISPNEIVEFQIDIIISDLIGEKDATLKITSNELSIEKDITLNVISMKNYFLNELNRLKNEIKIINESLIKQELFDLSQDLILCKIPLNQLEDSIKKEEFINAQDDIKETEDCIEKIENKSKRTELPFTNIKMTSYWVWIITWTLILILIAALATIIYILYKKLNIISFSRQKELKIQAAPIRSNKAISEKLQKIKERLG